MTFWIGFEKRAKELVPGSSEGSPTAGEIAAGAAAGVGVGATRHGYRDYKVRKKEKKFKRSKSIKRFTKKLKPGDIIFSGKAREGSEKIPLGKKIKLPFHFSEAVQTAGGGPQYHAAIYTGKGRIVEAPGTGDDPVSGAPVKKQLKGTRAVAYRPTGATKKEIQKALKSVKGFKGAPYKEYSEIVGQGTRTILDPTGGPKSCRRLKKGGPIVCNTLITKAYPKQFKKEYMMPPEMASQKGMKIVSKYNPLKAPGVREKAFTHAIAPMLRGAKWAVPGAALAYGGKKLHEYVTKKKAPSAKAKGAPKSGD